MPLIRQGAWDQAAQQEVINMLPHLAAPTILLVSGAIPPSQAAYYLINKAGVLVDTLAAPIAGTDDYKRITIQSLTANAHTLTATGLLQTGSSAVNLATFAANAGAGLTLMAYQGLWYVQSSVGITFS